MTGAAKDAATAPSTFSAVVDAARRKPLLFVSLVAAAVATARVAHLVVSPIELGVDEAQYWVWSRVFDWGYFSKPPLIAWSIAATTALFGQAEWAVRLSAPIFHALTAALLAALGLRLFGRSVGVWAGLAWLTLPGVVLSSFVISTDAPLLFFWTAALYCFFGLTAETRARARLLFGVGLGAAVGFGLLAKYAMIYFVIGAVGAALASPALRAQLRAGPLVAAAAVAGALVAPNIAWNAAHDFQTVAHTAANADWGDRRFDILQPLAFLAAQAGIVGPVYLALFAWGAATLRRRLSAVTRMNEIALLAFALPPIAIVAAQAFVSRAHANWAATAYPAALLLAIAWAQRAGRGGWVKAGTAINAAVAAAFLVVTASFTIVDALGAARAVRNVRGWAPQAQSVVRAAAGYDAVLVDDREIMSALLYYGREVPRVVALNSNNIANNHYEAAMAYDPARDRRVLFVTKYADPRGADAYYGRVRLVGTTSAALGPTKPRELYLYEATDPAARN